MTIEESKVINPMLMAVEEHVLMLNRTQLYERFSDAWMFSIKPVLNKNVGWYCDFPELQDSDIWMKWVDHIYEITTNLK